MNDFTKLNESIAKLGSALEAFWSGEKPPHPPSDQPAIDAAVKQLEAIVGSVPAPGTKRPFAKHGETPEQLAARTAAHLKANPNIDPNTGQPYAPSPTPTQFDPQTGKPRSFEPGVHPEGIDPNTGRPYDRDPHLDQSQINPATGKPYDQDKAGSQPSDPRGLNPATGRPYDPVVRPDGTTPPNIFSPAKPVV